MAAWIWVLIPLTAILVGAFKEWLEFKSKQDRLGTSAQALEGEVAALKEALSEAEAERQAAQRRLENLETIVTSEAWDALHASGLHGDASLNGRATPPLTLPDEDAPPADDAAATRRAAQMARRINGA